MTTTQTINSARTYAAIRAQRTMLAAKLATTGNPVARKTLQHGIELYDAELALAPVTAPVPHPTNRKNAAYKAWRTMLEQRIVGTRGKARAAIAAKIRHYDELLAA